MSKISYNLKKNEALKILKNGGFIKFDTLTAKYYIYTYLGGYAGKVIYNTGLSISMNSSYPEKGSKLLDIVRFEPHKAQFLNEYLETLKPGNTCMKELKKYIPEIENFSNEKLCKIKNHIEKLISIRNEDKGGQRC